MARNRRAPTPGEEIANSITHGIGAALSIAGRLSSARKLFLAGAGAEGILVLAQFRDQERRDSRSGGTGAGAGVRSGLFEEVHRGEAVVQYRLGRPSASVTT